MTGAFQAVEGPSGAGKTTMAALLAKHLREHGRDVVATCEQIVTAMIEQLHAADLLR